VPERRVSLALQAGSVARLAAICRQLVTGGSYPGLAAWIEGSRGARLPRTSTAVGERVPGGYPIAGLRAVDPDHPREGKPDRAPSYGQVTDVARGLIQT